MIKPEFHKIDFLYPYLGEQLNNDYLVIGDSVIPNFLKLSCNKILPNDAMIFEFNHLIYKMFIYKQNDKLTFYETPSFKINKDDIVFDCGANMGIFSAAIAPQCKHVYSFEPMSLIRKNLYEVQKLYNNITVIPKGIWNDCSEKIINQRDNPGASSMFGNEFNKILYKEKCHMISLDDFIDQTNIIPTFIKIDIEGAEIQLLEGAQKCLNNFGPKISIALHYNDQQNLDYIKSLLNNYNVEIFPQAHWGLVLLGEKNDN